MRRKLEKLKRDLNKLRHTDKDFKVLMVEGLSIREFQGEKKVYENLQEFQKALDEYEKKYNVIFVNLMSVDSKKTASE